MSKSRAWCFTLNNYKKEDIKHIQTLKCEYVFQEETGKNGTPHLQGYLYFTNAISFTSIKKKIPKAHIEPAKNKVASIRYCSKEDTRTGAIYTNLDLRKYKEVDTDTVELKINEEKKLSPSEIAQNELREEIELQNALRTIRNRNPEYYERIRNDPNNTRILRNAIQAIEEPEDIAY